MFGLDFPYEFDACRFCRQFVERLRLNNIPCGDVTSTSWKAKQVLNSFSILQALVIARLRIQGSSIWAI